MFASLAIRLLCECMAVCQGEGKAVTHDMVCPSADGGSANGLTTTFTVVF